MKKTHSISRLNFLFTYLRPGKILDVGNLGRAEKIHRVIMNTFSESEIHGIDIEDQKKYNLNFPNQKIGNAENMPYPDDYFNSIFLGQVIEHSWAPKKIVDECFRILQPGGILVLDTPNVYALSRMLRYFIKGKDVILGSPDHKIFYSRAMIENLLNNAGYHVLETSSDRKCTIKGINVRLPKFLAFPFLGEHLTASALKPECTRKKN